MIFNVLAMIKLEKLEAGKNNQAKWSFPHQNRMDLKCFKKKSILTFNSNTFYPDL